MLLGELKRAARRAFTNVNRTPGSEPDSATFPVSSGMERPFVMPPEEAGPQEVHREVRSAPGGAPGPALKRRAVARAANG
ncbi:MAG: hypothetical protein A2V77_21685 [Anaeromyxobacter sp. RBG_16_69_14]|nr:MAG: hypothetical protein A2V77_21685 [Anaeromyxobacter sp. RBG_16_69_14]